MPEPGPVVALSQERWEPRQHRSHLVGKGVVKPQSQQTGKGRERLLLGTDGCKDEIDLSLSSGSILASSCWAVTTFSFSHRPIISYKQSQVVSSASFFQPPFPSEKVPSQCFSSSSEPNSSHPPCLEQFSHHYSTGASCPASGFGTQPTMASALFTISKLMHLEEEDQL